MPRAPLFALVLLAACSGRVPEPGLSIAPDGGVAPVPGQPVDLLVEVDPGPGGVRVDGLSVEASSEGAEFGEPVLPPPDEEGVYGAPFTVRVPMTATATEPFEVEARASGEHREGMAFSIAATKEVFPGMAPGGGGIGLGAQEPDGSLLVHGTSLKSAPAVAGKLNALVVELEITGDQWHVYGAGTKNDPDALGVPMVAEILPTGPAADFLGVGPYSPPDKKYYGRFSIEIPFTPLKQGATEARLKLQWQACDPSICIDEQIRYESVSWEARPGDGTIEEPVGGLVDRPADGNGLGGQSLWILFLGAVAAGLFALVMPCTYPLIPITISFFTKQGEHRDGKTTGLALAYGAGIVAIFAGIGAVVGLGVLTGDEVLDFATNKWVNGLFALLFVYFGLSLIGLYEINLPSSVQNLAGRAGSGGGYMSVFAMGTTLVITSFTCTAPFVGALLAYAAQSGGGLRVTAAMGVFGLTMAIPFVFLSLSPKALSTLPKSGEWMKHLKVSLGIIEIGLALKFISNVDLALGTQLIHRELFIVLFGAAFLAAAVYLADIPGLVGKRKWAVGRGTVIGIVVLLAITGFFYSGLDGEPLPVKELEAFLPNWDAKYDDNFLAVVKEDYEKGIARAKKLGAPVFLHFTGFQ